VINPETGEINSKEILKLQTKTLYFLKIAVIWNVSSCSLLQVNDVSDVLTARRRGVG
jgi:hypothetical protein